MSDHRSIIITAVILVRLNTLFEQLHEAHRGPTLIVFNDVFLYSIFNDRRELGHAPKARKIDFHKIGTEHLQGIY